MPRRILVVVNQRKLAGRRLRLYRAVVEGMRARGHAITELPATPSTGGLILDDALDGRPTDQVVIAGGDGTVNRVLQEWRHPEIPLALIPLGTCNLVAKECGYPADAAGILRVIDEGPREPFYVARANGQVCAIAAGCGIDSYVLDSLVWRWKKRLGRVYVVWKSGLALLRYRPRLFEVRVDGSPVRGTTVGVLKGRYWAGPFSLSEDASLFQPVLYSVVNEHTSFWRQLSAIIAIFTGNTRRLAEILTITPARTVEIDGPADFPVQVDGDVRCRTPARIELNDEPFLMCISPQRPGVPHPEVAASPALAAATPAGGSEEVAQAPVARVSTSDAVDRTALRAKTAGTLMGPSGPRPAEESRA